MRKAMLIFLCFALIGVMISCNNAHNTCLNNTGTTQMTDTVQNAYSKKEASKKQVFRNYDDILDRYRALLLIRYNNSNIENPQIYLDENDYRIETALNSVIINSNTDQMGYAICDIDNNTQPELFLMDECYHIFAVFSQLEECPVLLDTFLLNNHYVSISKDGTFCKTGYGKGENSYTQIMKISKSGEFEILLEYGCCDDGSNYEYYILENNIKSIVPPQDIAVLQKQYENFLEDPSEITKTSGLVFVPIKNNIC